jgi:hypothetical protein
VRGVDTACAAALTPDVVRRAVEEVPEVWLVDEPGFASVGELREAYATWFTGRLAGPRPWLADLRAVQAAPREARRG